MRTKKAISIIKSSLERKGPVNVKMVFPKKHIKEEVFGIRIHNGFVFTIDKRGDMEDLLRNKNKTIVDHVLNIVKEKLE